MPEELPPTEIDEEAMTRAWAKVAKENGLSTERVHPRPERLEELSMMKAALAQKRGDYPKANTPSKE